MKIFRKLIPTFLVEGFYIRAGAIFGDAVSYSYLGECEGFEKLLDIWGKWEEEYARRGYRTIDLDRFVRFGGYGQPIDDLVGQRREQEEKAIFYAQRYRENFLGRTKPIIHLEEIAQEKQEREPFKSIRSVLEDAADIPPDDRGLHRLVWFHFFGRRY